MHPVKNLRLNGASKYYEGRKRTIAKTITYRVLIVISTFIVSYFILKDLRAALNLTVGANLINMILYYLHERIWNRLH